MAFQPKIAVLDLSGANEIAGNRYGTEWHGDHDYEGEPMSGRVKNCLTLEPVPPCILFLGCGNRDCTTLSAIR